MANLSPLTRKDQVLRYLQEHADQWVDGPELANERVGGSEGLKRVRELRADNHRIVTRPHPDRSRDIFQYKLVPPDRIAPVVQERLDQMAVIALPLSPPEPIEPEKPLTPAGRPFLMHRNEETGTYELTKEVCVECGGLYDDDLEHRTTDARHLRWVEAQRKLTADQLTVGVPEQPAPFKFTKMPDRIDLGTMALCPRCHGHRRKGRTWFSRKQGKMIETPSEDFTRDPFRPEKKGEPNPCERCGGFGIVPQFVQEGQVAVQPAQE